MTCSGFISCCKLLLSLPPFLTLPDVWVKERANPPTPALLLTPPSALPSLSPSFRSPSILHLLNTQRRARDAERQWMRGWMPSALPHLSRRLLLSLIQAASVHLFLPKCDGKTRMFSPSFLHHNLAICLADVFFFFFVLTEAVLFVLLMKTCPLSVFSARWFSLPNFHCPTSMWGWQRRDCSETSSCCQDARALWCFGQVCSSENAVVVAFPSFCTDLSECFCTALKALSSLMWCWFYL